MIIFGSRYYFVTVGNGTFLCPRCQWDRPYLLRRGRRFFHVLYIPLIPVSAANDIVQCGQCQSRFTPAILGMPVA
jgi:zinc-ribbon family